MGKYLNLGNAGFQSIRKGLYVDKSGIISFVNAALGTADKLICVSRPRRFGKSFATKMLCAYYDRSCDSKALFEGLEIEKDSSFSKHLNQYDVIYLDITWFISTCANGSNIVEYLQKQVIEELADIYPFVQGNESLPMALSTVNEKTGNKFVIIMDEWDALFREKKEDIDLQKEYIRLLRGLFKSSLTDKMIELAYMTGILPVKKYGTQSALTDFREYTMTSPKQLAKYTGFTELEVKQLCEKFDIDFEETKKWYDGYSFSGAKSIYNPNAIMEIIKNREFETYWTETETYESLKMYIELDLDGLKEAIVLMLAGEHCPVDIGTFQNDMTNINNKDDVLTLLVHLGYLAYNAKSKSVHIPNEEVRLEFIRSVKGGKRMDASLRNGKGKQN